MSGGANLGCPRFKSKPPARTFQAGKQYTRMACLYQYLLGNTHGRNDS